MFLRPMHLLCRCIFLCIALFCLSTPALSSSVFADSNPITITSQTDTVHFPDAIDFQMSATDSTSPITSASLTIRFNHQSMLLRTVPVNTPGKTISLHWHEDTSGDNFETPGSSVLYYWTLQDNAGHNLVETSQIFTTTDTRFTWQHLAQGKIQVNWYGRSQSFGQLLLSNATSSLTRISSNLGGGLIHNINLWVYASPQDFHGALAPNSYEWVGGEAFPDLNEAFISVDGPDDDTLIRDMPHEMTHLVFHQLIEQGIYAPTWFDEGMAVYNQQYHEPEMALRFQDALAHHALIPLNSITMEFPADADKAYLAYAQSWNLVSYMYKTFGKAKMAQLIKNMNNPTTDMDTALKGAIGINVPHLENQWHLSLNQPATLTDDQQQPATQTTTAKPHFQYPSTTDKNAPFLITLGTVLVILPALGLTLLFIQQRRRRHQSLAVQEAQNIMNMALGPQQYRQPYTPIPPSARYPSQAPLSPYQQPYGPRSEQMFGPLPPKGEGNDRTVQGPPPPYHPQPRWQAPQE